jgi:nucleoside-diphosphate-sugar epimerase
MIIGITGGTGFVGRALVSACLSAGDDVRVLTRQRAIDTGLPVSAQVFNGDLANASKGLISFVDGVDIIYNCAVENKNPSKMYSTNVLGVDNLCNAASGRIGRWVQLSSVAVYGNHDGIFTENAPLYPVSVYGKTKAKSEDIIINYARKNAFAYSTIRSCKVFGVGMKDQSLLQLISIINKRLFFFIGNPGASANYVHVDNVVDSLLRCGKASAAKNRVYNVSDCRTIETFVEIIAKELNKPIPNVRLPESLARCIVKIFGRLPKFPLSEARLKGLLSRIVYPIRLIQSELGYTHKVSVEDGLNQIIEHWKRYL